MLTPVNSHGQCMAEMMTDELRNARMPYGGRRAILEIGREYPPAGEDVFPGPNYSWGRQASLVGYGPTMVPYADYALTTGARVRPIFNSELEKKVGN